METTSPTANSPVSVPPTPSSPNSFDRPQKEMGSPERNISTARRMSTEYRGKRRAPGLGGFELEIRTSAWFHHAMFVRRRLSPHTLVPYPHAVIPSEARDLGFC